LKKKPFFKLFWFFYFLNGTSAPFEKHLRVIGFFSIPRQHTSRAFGSATGGGAPYPHPHPPASVFARSHHFD